MVKCFIFCILVATVSACATTAGPVNQPAATETGQSASEAVLTSPDQYVLDQGDRILIQVFDEPDLTMEVVISAGGIINYSYLGDLQVGGKTPSELEEQISGQLRDGYLVNPSVNVSVIQFRPFFIGGEVRSPGSYPFQPGLTMTKAIALAGGLTDRASQRQMFIVRAGSPVTSQTQATLGTPVGPGDIITIKEGFF